MTTPLASIIEKHLFSKFKKTDSKIFFEYFLFLSAGSLSNQIRSLALDYRLFLLDNPIKNNHKDLGLVSSLFLIDKFSPKLVEQPSLNKVCRVRSCTILLKIIFSVIHSPQMFRPKKSFEHVQIVVLIYATFEVVHSINLVGRNRTPNQNFLILQRFLYA